MKTLGTGLLLALQFFTIVPITKQLPMTKRTMTAMYSMLPVIGVLIGGVLYGAFRLLQHADTTPLFMVVILLVIHIVCTGGLHLDGYVDVSDAFFSYGDRQKRLEILEDPRTGAFGVISVVVLMLLQVAAMYELYVRNIDVFAIVLFVVPIVLRTAVQLYFTTMKCAKTSGIAYYFATNMQLAVVKYTAVVVLLAIAVAGFVTGLHVLLAAVVVQLLLVWLYRKFSYKHFGGMNGDLSGALYEGSQTVLWGMLLLFI